MVYVAYSNDHDIFLVHSTDKGVNWSQPVRVSNGAETKTSVLPWIETGPTPGSVGIAWFGTTSAANDDAVGLMFDTERSIRYHDRRRNIRRQV